MICFQVEIESEMTNPDPDPKVVKALEHSMKRYEKEMTK